jgi:hypothetical protein
MRKTIHHISQTLKKRDTTAPSPSTQPTTPRRHDHPALVARADAAASLPGAVSLLTPRQKTAYSQLEQALEAQKRSIYAVKRLGNEEIQQISLHTQTLDRAMVNLTHADTLTPFAANQAHVDKHLAAELLLTMLKRHELAASNAPPNDDEGDANRPFLLHAALLATLRRAAWRHMGVEPTELMDLSYHDHLLTAFGFVSRPPGNAESGILDGPNHYTAYADGNVEAGKDSVVQIRAVVRHETTHESQNAALDSRVASPLMGHHPRAGALAASASIDITGTYPTINDNSPCFKQVRYELYRSQPWEIQAHRAAAEVEQQLNAAPYRANPHTLDLPEAEIAELALFIQTTVGGLDTQSWPLNQWVTNRHPKPAHVFKAEHHDAALAQLERLLGELGRIRQAATSAVWRGKRSQQLARSLKTRLSGLGPTAPGQDAVQRLAGVADELKAFHQRLQAEEGIKLYSVAVRDATPHPRDLPMTDWQQQLKTGVAKKMRGALTPCAKQALHQAQQRVDAALSTLRHRIAQGWIPPERRLRSVKWGQKSVKKAFKSGWRESAEDVHNRCLAKLNDWAESIEECNKSARWASHEERQALLQQAGFADQVCALQAQQGAGAQPQAQVVANIVHSLAHTLLGLPPEKMPPLEVHIFEADAVQPHLEGYTVAAHQKRKPHFVADLGLIEMPKHSLQNPACLAKLAVDVAAHVQRTTCELPDDFDFEGNPAFRSAYEQALEQACASLGPMKTLHEFETPFETVLTEAAHQQQHAAQAWHQTYRAQVKVQARDATKSAPERQAAQQTYAQTAQLRHQDAFIAFRRAMGLAAKQALKP